MKIYAWYRHLIVLLRKYEMITYQRKALRPGIVETTHDYAKILSLELNKEIMRQYFSNFFSLLIEGASVRFFERKASSITKITYMLM